MASKVGAIVSLRHRLSLLLSSHKGKRLTFYGTMHMMEVLGRNGLAQGLNCDRKWRKHNDRNNCVSSSSRG